MLTIGFGGIASAQTKPAKKKHVKKHATTKKTTLKSTTNHAALDQRKIYHWDDGQRATPTGNEATGIGETKMVSKDAKKTKGGSNRGGQ